MTKQHILISSLFAVGLAAGAYALNHRLSTEQTDFRSVKFGMSPAEVKNAEHSLKASEETNGWIMYENVVTSELSGESRGVSLYYHFVDSKLSSACYLLNPAKARIPTPELRNEYDALASKLTASAKVHPTERRQVLNSTVGRDDYDFVSTWNTPGRPTVILRLETENSTSLGTPYVFNLCSSVDASFVKTLSE